LAERWRTLGSALFRYGKQVFPFLVSGGLVTWLVWRITPEKLFAALSGSRWPWLVFASVVQLVVLFLWDTINLWWLFSQPDPSRRPPFRLVLRERCNSILWSAINLELGQGVFAYKLATALHESVGQALGRFLVLDLFDFGTLQSLGLLGSFLVTNPLIEIVRWVCLASTLGLIVLALLFAFMPAPWRKWLEDKSWGSWLRWWGWRHSLLLWAQRLTMFLLVYLYAYVGLLICGIALDARTVFGTIPFVLIAESLPGTGGLGERETALVYLLDPGDKAAVLLSFGLIWSTVVILGRILIGLGAAVVARWKERESSRVSGTNLASPLSELGADKGGA
jgi:hypothetical protein